jgi:hypothetical protein
MGTYTQQVALANADLAQLGAMQGLCRWGAGMARPKFGD